jgi:hypothetical protein
MNLLVMKPDDKSRREQSTVQGLVRWYVLSLIVKPLNGTAGAGLPSGDEGLSTTTQGFQDLRRALRKLA